MSLFVTDQYGDIWNIEGFANRKQANDFKYYIQRELNSPRDLRIIGTPDGNTHIKTVNRRSEKRLSLFPEADF